MSVKRHWLSYLLALENQSSSPNWSACCLTHGLISTRAPISQVKEAAARAGVRTLRDSALDLVRQGVTTLEEVIRVTSEDEA